MEFQALFGSVSVGGGGVDIYVASANANISCKGILASQNIKPAPTSIPPTPKY